MVAFQAIAGRHDKPSNEVLACLLVYQHGVSMKLIIQKASVRWQGGSNGGTRAMTTESGVLKETGFSLGIPFTKNSGTNPAELIAAAHAASFSLALSNELGLAGSASGDIVVTATVTLEHLAAGWTIMNIHLNVIARLLKVTQGRFIDATVRAKTSCLVSRLLRANISMNARLEK
ncbi:MAG TPA: OsmC family peroxiredoxin [Candidatus Sulfopaludibacter sp.]|nr:OsmC family peroxiredoxin [Candidatus Sulfopaludibacter sp.]